MSRQYNELYIYYVKGRIRDAENRLGPGFIGNWQEEDSAFLFFDCPQEEKVAGVVERDPELELVDSFSMSYEQWHGGEILPFSTDCFHVAPPWSDETAPENRIALSIDPGVVFGAGTHTTTRFCLEALEIACGENPPDSVLDLGTGTGLLAVAAASMGCRKVLAVDSNFLAARTARKNIDYNRLGSRALAIQADARQLVDCPAELVIANIHFDVMRQLIASPAFYEKKWFVLSGLLRSQARYVEEMFCYGPARIVQRWTGDGIWYTFLATSGG